jgi:hypothetical protein
VAILIAGAAAYLLLRRTPAADAPDSRASPLALAATAAPAPASAPYP